jgi:SET domain-containing protein
MTTSVKSKKLSKYTPGDFNLRVKRSTAGLGLFAGQDIPKGVCVVEYVGRVISKEEEETSKSQYLFEVSKNKTINGDARSNIARYVNYSHKPNIETVIAKGRVFYFSKRAIKAGDELTVDYGKEFYDEHIQPYGCKCAVCLANSSK